ncbi:MAG TPA: type I restriction endonuclease subunit R [Thermoanaerobaculia bacterium]|nr:type I restriction endonuclease subunit R [Thermoanaerobaculia bacterium]
MALTAINTEDRLVQQTFATHLREVLGWETVYTHNSETFGPNGTLGRDSERDAILKRELRSALERLNPKIPESARESAVEKLTRNDLSRSLIQHNRDFYTFIREGVPVEWADESGVKRYARARVLDFRDITENRFLAVRELKIQGMHVPHYNRRADLVCFVNGLPLVFIELKAVYKNIRAGFDENLTDYLNESIPHAFHHNAFLIVSNGDRARYGSITSKWDHFAEWKRDRESDKGRVDAEALLDGMLPKDRLLDIVENFILFDDSRAGGTRKIVARNHQVLGVNNAVASVERQEELKREYPPGARLLEYRAPVSEGRMIADAPVESLVRRQKNELVLPQRAHPDLGRLGVFWHTQGSGKSYSMAFFSEKVRRAVPGNFTFLIMTDREDLDDQIWRTFIGCGITDEMTPRAGSGKDLKALLAGNHRYVFSLIHKFNQPVAEPYSDRDDIIVISDEAHRTQMGRFARNMRQALPNASFIGFTGTPILKHDHLTNRIFGGYVSRYDFKRSEEDGSTVKLIYESRGEKLGLARLDLNDRIAEAVEVAELDDDQTALIEKLLGKDYEVITADDRLDKLADDFVEHCSTRWETGKSMFVCIDKITCGRMFQRIEKRWQARLLQVKAQIAAAESDLAMASDPDDRERIERELDHARGRERWMESTIVEIIISEAQNEVRDFAKWGVDIVPHRVRMKRGFETPDGKRMSVEDAFKDPSHPFRVAIVCAMWLTGFDVESLATLYVDKPMKAHTLMQAIARANRIFPGKDCGVIVDYNGMLKSLRKALADYALGDEDEGETSDEPAAPIEELVGALIDAIEAAERHLSTLGFDATRLHGATGFTKIEALRDAVDACYTSDEAKRRFEIIARQVFIRMKALLMEPAAWTYAERHDNLEAIYKKLQERRDTADVTTLLKALHRIVNEAIRAQEAGDDHAEGLTVDLSGVDFEKLREEFARKVRRKHAALQDIRDIVEQKLAAMLAANPLRMDYYRRYQEIVADYNREKDRVTVEATFAALVDLVASLDDEQQRAAREGLGETELAFFDLMRRDTLSAADRERLKQVSRHLLSTLQALLSRMPRWTENESTQAEVQTSILDELYETLPRPPFEEDEINDISERVYQFVWKKSSRSEPLVF